MTYSPKAIGNYYIIKGEESKVSLTPQKLIKLIYIAHGWMLGLDGGPLINECPVNNGYGPMLMDVHARLDIFGNDSIYKGYRLKESVFVSERDLEWRTVPAVLDSDTKPLVDKVWDAYGVYSGPQLSTITNKEGSPARKAWENRGKYSKCIPIPEEEIKNYYKGLSNENSLHRNEKH